MFGIGAFKQRMPHPDDALPGRQQAVMPAPAHAVNGGSLRPEDYPGAQTIIFAMGCFWGAERMFWKLPGVLTTAVGYAGGYTPNPTYSEACSGQTGHAEAVQVVFDPEQVSVETLLRTFWEGHDPTQGMRQGNDRGTEYRSAIYTSSDFQLAAAQASAMAFQAGLVEAGFGAITTEIKPAGAFYYAEPEHQQYLATHPGGYCGLGGTGVSCQVGLGASAP